MNARLVALDPSFPTPEFPIPEKGVAIGRSRQNDLCLDNPSVSRLHATIRVVDGKFVIEDRGSLHGTLVNEKRIDSHQLASNDLIEIGIYRFRFVEGSGTYPTATIDQQEVDHLRMLLDVSATINSTLALDQALNYVIDAVIQLTQAERGFLMMLNPAGELEVKVARNFDHTTLSTEGISASFSILDQVRRTGEPVVLSDILDATPAATPLSVVALGLRSVMCVPMKTPQRLIGVIYVDSHRQAKRFLASDLEIFHSLASQAALGIEKSQLYDELQRYSSSLEEQVRERTADLVHANNGLAQAYSELQQAQAEIIKSENHAAVGRLAAGIAHEINSPLGVITSNVDTLRHLVARFEGTLKDPDVLEMLDTIVQSSKAASARVHQIIKAFEAFTGLDQAELKAININDVLGGALTLLEHECGIRIRIVKEFGDLQPILCSPGRIHQAFMNLIVNAIQAIDGEGEIRIRTAQKDSGIEVTIQDTGRGMTPQELAEAFHGGIARKAGRMSARLGLVITEQIFREHSGTIRINSKPGEGTTVTVSLPNS